MSTSGAVCFAHRESSRQNGAPAHRDHTCHAKLVSKRNGVAKRLRVLRRDLTDRVERVARRVQRDELKAGLGEAVDQVAARADLGEQLFTGNVRSGRIPADP